MTTKKEYCQCFSKMDDFIGEGKILGCHLKPIGDGCGGYITDKMLRAHNPNHPLVRSS